MPAETTAINRSEPTLVIRPRRGWSALDLGELWEFRDLLRTLAARDVKLRYRQTALGVLWVVLQPLIAAGIFSFVFGKIAKLPSGGVPYLVFAYTGLLGWTPFANTLSRTSSALVSNSALVSKVYFPRLILPLSTVFSGLIDFLVALGLMAVLMAIFQIPPHAGLLLMPVLLAVLLLLALGLGLVAAALMVSYRDVGYMIPVLTNMLLYLSPVAYLPTGVGNLYYLNPLAGVLEAFRWSILGVGEPPWPWVAYSACFAATVFAVGTLAFKRMERRFADVI